MCWVETASKNHGMAAVKAAPLDPPALAARLAATARQAGFVTTPYGAIDGCPLLALWGAKGVVNRLFDPVADWGSVANDVRGRALPCGHFLAEEAPGETLAELQQFFG